MKTYRIKELKNKITKETKYKIQRRAFFVWVDVWLNPNISPSGMEHSMSSPYLAISDDLRICEDYMHELEIINSWEDVDKKPKRVARGTGA